MATVMHTKHVSKALFNRMIYCVNQSGWSEIYQSIIGKTNDHMLIFFYFYTAVSKAS